MAILLETISTIIPFPNLGEEPMIPNYPAALIDQIIMAARV